MTSDPDALAHRFIDLGPGHLQQLVHRAGGQRAAARCMKVSHPLVNRWLHEGATLEGWAGYPRAWRRLDEMLGQPVLLHPLVDRAAWRRRPLNPVALGGTGERVPWPSSVAALDRLAQALVGIDWVELVQRQEEPHRRPLPSGAVQAILRHGLARLF